MINATWQLLKENRFLKRENIYVFPETTTTYHERGNSGNRFLSGAGLLFYLPLRDHHVSLLASSLDSSRRGTTFLGQLNMLVWMVLQQSVSSH